MTVDVHVHMGSFPSIEGAGPYLRTRRDVAAFRSRHPELYARYEDEQPVDNSDRLLATMDRYEIGVSLIQPRPGIDNDFVAGMASRHPERLRALALPTPWPTPKTTAAILGNRDDTSQQVADATTDCFARHGMRGVGELYLRRITSAIHPEDIADALSPMMQALEPDRLPVQIPTAWTQFPGGLYYGDPLWVDELACRFPTVPIVLTKMGRGIDRFFDSALTVALRNANVFFDTSDTSVDHLRRAIDVIGPDRIMYGSDWSATWQFLSDPGSVHDIAHDRINRATDDPGVRQQILDVTARSIYTQLFGE